MFDKIILSRSVSGPPLTAGELAEALLFYQNVHVVFNISNLASLISSIGAPMILMLLARPGFSAVYCEDKLATHTRSALPFDTHSFVGITFSGNQTSGIVDDKKKRLRHFLQNNMGLSKKDAKKFTERFLDSVPIKRLTSNYFIEGGIVNAALGDLDDPTYVHEAIRLALEARISRPIGNFNFRVFKTGRSFYVVSDLNYTDIKNSGLTEGHLINEILEARSDIILAGHYGSEFYTAATSSNIIRLKYGAMLRRLEIETNECSNFMDIVADGKSIKEVIDSGEKSFDEFLQLLDKAERFKEWTKNINPDEKIVKQYFEEVTRKGWMESLPGKSIRYVLGAMIGAIKPEAGLAMSAADTFLFDKLKLGWRPSHFVEGRLKKFLDT